MLELLAGAALRCLLLAAAVGMGLRLRRTCNPNVSLAAWTLVLAASLLMPAAMRLTASAIPQGGIAVGQLPLMAAALIQSEAPFVTLDAEPSGPADLAAAHLCWREVASFLYLAVFSALMLRLLVGLSRSWRIVRAATPVPEHRAGGLDVRASPRIDAPATFGSVILLPGDHAAWTPARLLAVLAHEGAHVARRDFAIQLAASVNRTVFWFNPFSWWLRRHLSDLAEAASDDAAVARLGDRIAYAEILLEISGRVSRLPGAVSMARHAAVASRIDRILAETPLSAGMSRRGRAMLAACIVPVAVLLSFLIILPAPPPEPLLPAVVGSLGDAGVAEGVKQPAPIDAPRIGATEIVPPSAPMETSAPAIAPSPAQASRIDVASPPPSTPSRRPPRLLPNAVVTAQPPRTIRQPNRVANNQGGFYQSSGPEAINVVAAPSDTAGRAVRATGSIGEDGKSALFKRIANETCRGTYTGLVRGAPAEVRFQPVQAHFYRGPGDAPWVTFHFAAQKAADLPVTIDGNEIKFADPYGMTYTLLPSRGVLLPPRYHRLIGSAEHPARGTIDFACEDANRPL